MRSIFGVVVILFVVALWKIIQRTLDSRRKERVRRRAKEALRLSNPEGGGPPVIPGGLDAVPEDQRYSCVEQQAQHVAALVTSASPSELRTSYVKKIRLFSGGPLMVAYKDDFIEEKVFKGEVACEVLLRGVGSSKKAMTVYVLWANGCGCWQTGGNKVHTEPIAD
jgi:hypothetical protein